MEEVVYAERREVISEKQTLFHAERNVVILVKQKLNNA
jgi:hypothetical protein